MKILVVMTIKSDKGKILDVIDGIKKHAPGVDYLVINGTAEFRVESRLVNNKIPHIKTAYFTRHGDSFAIGVQHAIDNNYDAVIEYDSNGNFDPRDIPYLVRTYENSGASLILGTRYLTKDSKPTARTKWLRRWIMITTGKKVTDAGLRFRLIGSDLLHEFNAESWWAIGPDIIAYLVKNKVKYKEVQVAADKKRTIEYNTIRKSAANTWTDILSMIFVQRFRRYGKGVNNG